MIDDGSILLDTSPSLIASMPKSKSYEIRYYYRGDDSIRSNYYDLERELSVDLPLSLVSLNYCIIYRIHPLYSMCIYML